MDISYLLALQNLREACGSVVEKIISALTDIPFNPLTILLICTLYWCIDKRMGFFILFSQSFGTFVNNVIKLCVCAYRPWIRDTRINPPLKAKAGATGYSFPSGHTQSVVGEYGTLGYALIKKDKENKNHKWLWAIIVCAFLILIVAFSRNFLSVHTPQDVLVGLCVGLIIVWLTDIILRVEQRDEENKKNVDLWIVIGGSVLIVLATLLVLLKKYPMDYADGVLIVDPAVMKNDFFSGAGSFLALLWGWFIEKRFVKFDTECTVLQKILRVLTGGIVIGFIFILTSLCLKPLIHSMYVYYSLKYFLLYFVVTFVHPACFMAVHKKLSKVSNS